MKERTRNPSRSASPSKIAERVHRFLRPGALARLRDARISSRMAPRSAAAFLRRDRLSPPSSPPLYTSPATASSPIPAVDGFPCFLTGTRGPRFPQRKKLLAAKAVFLVPGSPVGVDPTGSPLLGTFNADPLLAH